MRKLLLVFIAGIFVGEIGPIERGIWLFLERWLEEEKAESVEKPSPFLAVDQKEWIAESAHAFAIPDINPRAPVHLLVISKEPFPTLFDAPEVVLGDMINLAKELARSHGIEHSGFRIQANVNPKGGQSVYHLHIHILGGRQMREELLPHILGFF